MGLICQAMGCTHSNRSGCPFPLTGWRQSPSSLGHSTHCLLLVNINWRTSRGLEVTSALLFCLSACPVENRAAFILEEFPAMVVLPLRYPCFQGRGRFSIPLPHVFSAVTQEKTYITLCVLFLPCSGVLALSSRDSGLYCGAWDSLAFLRLSNLSKVLDKISTRLCFLFVHHKAN